jgi:hypothetical protein
MRGWSQPDYISAEDFVYNKLGTVVAVVLAIFPFAAVLAKLAATETSVTIIVVAAIFAILFAVLLIATRITLEPDPEVAKAPRQPAPPITWSWDGVNREPGADDEETSSTEAHS